MSLKSNRLRMVHWKLLEYRHVFERAGEKVLTLQPWDLDESITLGSGDTVSQRPLGAVSRNNVEYSSGELSRLNSLNFTKAKTNV